MTSRDSDRGAKAAKEISEETGNVNIHALILDLTCQQSILNFTNQSWFQSKQQRKDRNGEEEEDGDEREDDDDREDEEEREERSPRIDMISFNAGIMNTDYEMSKQGYEMQYQLNHLSNLLLLRSLLPIMCRDNFTSKKRIVFTASRQNVCEYLLILLFLFIFHNKLLLLNICFNTY